MKLKSKPFRIAVAGATTDGRTITPEWIEQMAATYSPEKYTARINCEHLRGIMPESVFGSFGDVVALTKGEVEIDGEQKAALFAQLAPTPELVALNKKRQKVFTSMEVDPDFAGSGQAYLVGLAVTDSPASLGTEMLEFAAKATLNPLTERKQKAENLFSASVEAQLEFTDETPLMDKLKDMFKKQDKKVDQSQQDYTQAVELLGTEMVAINARIDALDTTGANDNDEQYTALLAEVEGFKKQVSDLTATLSTMPNFTKRPPAAGRDNVVLTDC